MKKHIIRILSIITILTMITPLHTANANQSHYNTEAEVLHSLGLFTGTNKGFELSRPANRAESATILVRLLGKEKEASTYQGDIPFDDVPTWAKKNIDYLYKNNLTQGLSSNKFGASNLITANDYITFILRSLGYSDKQGDFKWSNAVEKAVDIGLININEAEKLKSKKELLRGDIVFLSYNALFIKEKSNDKSLISKLIQDKAISEEQYKNASLLHKPIYIHLSSLGYKVDHKTEPVNPTKPEEDKAPEYKEELTAVEISQTLRPSIVYIEAILWDDSTTQGSGVIINDSGLILTNQHVIEDAKEVNVKLSNGKTIKAEGYTDKDEDLDLAIIKINPSGSNLLPIEIGDSNKIKNGETTYAYGNPFGLDYTISQGIISSTNRVISSYNGGELIQFTAAISSGSSGGALIDSKGRLIGITTATYMEAQNLNFAVPINKYTSLSQSDVKEFYVEDIEIDYGREIYEWDYGYDFLYDIELNNNDMAFGALYDYYDIDTFSISVNRYVNLSAILGYSDEFLGEYLHMNLYNQYDDLIASSYYDWYYGYSEIYTNIGPGNYRINVFQVSDYKYLWDNDTIYMLRIELR